MSRPTPSEIAARLHVEVGAALVLFESLDEARSGERARPGVWSAREIVGHLIDSACNNHRRFVLGQSPGALVVQAYEQEAWVAVQRHQDRPWRDLVALWAAYNRHLVHVIGCMTADAASNRVRLPDGSEADLLFLMDDYVGHLRHHVDQIRARLAVPSA